jgi:pimeloyl-ACP methyl ester carboxylesterase
MQNSQDILIADAIIHCEISGNEDAPVLIFLHGNGEDLHIFDRQISHFSQYYRTIAVDTRGHGKSSRGTKPLNFHTFADDLVRLFDALKIDKANIVGFSDGAIIALHTVLIAPERVSSMVLLGVNYNPKGLLMIPRLQILFAYACLSAASLFSDKIRRRKEIWGLMVFLPELTIEEISQIKIPALVVTGEKDMVKQRHNDEIKNAIQGSQRLIIPDGDHFWMFKQQEKLNDCITNFLKDI